MKKPRVLLLAAVFIITCLSPAGVYADGGAQALTTSSLPEPLRNGLMLDVDFSGGEIIDHAEGRTFGNNTHNSNIIFDNVLDKHVGVINGDEENVWTTAWSAADWLAINESVTMEALFRVDDHTDPWVGILCSGGTGLNLNYAGTIRTWLYMSADINGSWKASYVQIEYGIWYHAVATYNGIEQNLYLNGVLVHTDSRGGNFAGSITTTVPSIAIGGNAIISETDRPLDGAVATARVWNRVLGAADIAELYQVSGIAPDPLKDGLMLDVDFSGGAITDLAMKRTFDNNTHNSNITHNRSVGKYVGEINKEAENAWRTPWPLSDWTAIAQSVTMETLFRVDNPGSEWMGVFGNGYGDGVIFCVYPGSATHSKATFSASIEGQSWNEPEYMIEHGVWYHAVGTYDGHTMKFYINGTLVDSIEVVETTAAKRSITAPAIASRFLVIGGCNSGTGGIRQNFDGSVGLARVWNRVLSDAEIKELADEIEIKGVDRRYDRTDHGDGTKTVEIEITNRYDEPIDFSARLGILGDAGIICGTPLEEVLTIESGETESVSWIVEANNGSARLIISSTVDGDDAREEPMGRVTTRGAGWVSGDIHVHSTHSDGTGTMAESFASANRAGMDFINIADHDTFEGWDCDDDSAVAAAAANGMIAIRGNETAIRTTSFSDVRAHLIFMNVGGTTNRYDEIGRSVYEAIALMRADSGDRGLVFAAHPYDTTTYSWSGRDTADPFIGLEGSENKDPIWDADIDGIEVWNGWYAANFAPNKRARETWDKLNTQGRRLFGVATTDAHSADGWGAVYTTAYVNEYTADGVVDAYKRGNMYGSNGPVIDFKVGNAMMGDDYSVPHGGIYVNVKLSGYYINELERVLLIRNGVVVETINLDGAKSFDETVPVFVVPGDFVRMEVEGRELGGKSLTIGDYGNHAFFTQAPFAFSNPIFFTLRTGYVLGREAVTVADASLVFRGLLGLADLTTNQRQAAALGDDGEPNIGHVLRIFRYALGLSDII
jgi:hypothetical protein